MTVDVKSLRRELYRQRGVVKRRTATAAKLTIERDDAQRHVDNLEDRIRQHGGDVR